MVAQTEPQISIKGVREGLLITLGNGVYADILARLEEELTTKQTFLQGSQVILAVGDRALRLAELRDVQQMLAERGLTLWAVLADLPETRDAARQLELATRLPGSQTDLEGNMLETAVSPSHTPEIEPPSANCLLLAETLRSGRSVYYEGHVVIIGDVNPGAEIIAGGNVVVWGRLRGLVHAGALGDETAVICALDLSPTQLRIANQIAIPPDEPARSPIPEKAFIKQGQIIAEPWQIRK
ncbi:MAG: septum site-determining protein MinC [Chloroflexi bacterium]|nr:MAG: septum site-determining protein MinC [Chloroflexota bacterium]